MVAWSEVDYRRVDCLPGVERFVNALKSLYVNGKVNSWIFDACSPVQFDNALRDDRQAYPFHELNSFLAWLSRQDVKDELNFTAPPREVAELGGFACEGDLTHLLCAGGAYAGLSNEVPRDGLNKCLQMC